MGIIAAIIVFLLVVMLHELGHFAVAKMVGIKVLEFSIGMGPVIYSNEKGETKYSLRALPIGGYVAMEGEETDSDDERSFNNAKVSSRIAVVLAGATMNFVLAIVAFFIINMVRGFPTAVINDFTENSPAYTAGMRSGDKVISIDGTEIKSWDEISKTISHAVNEKMDFVVERDGESVDLQIPVVEQNIEGYGTRKIVGIIPKNETSFGQSVIYAFKDTGYVIKMVFSALRGLVTGGVHTQDLAGPIGVINIISEQSKNGILSVISILGLISANLGVMNLLPIPALDGGKILFLLIEAIKGKPVNTKVEQGFATAGIMLLFALMLYVTIFGDLKRILGW